MSNSFVTFVVFYTIFKTYNKFYAYLV